MTSQSIEDQAFLALMDQQVFIDETNSWVAPLPFRTPCHCLPNNYTQASKRLSSLRRRGCRTMVLTYIWSLSPSEAGVDKSGFRLKHKAGWDLPE